MIQTSSQPTLRVAALGDIMLDREVGKRYFAAPRDFQLSELADYLSRYDLVIANLENPVGLRGNPHPKQDPHVAFRCHPDTLQVLNNLNVDVVTLANNHLLDYGAETLADTLDHLDNAGIKHLGAGRNYEEANRPVIVNVGGGTVAIVATVMIYSASTERASGNRPGVADFNIKRLLKQIRALKGQGHAVIATIHWGIEYCLYPIPYQRQQAKAMIDAGASLIVGHGPHFPQGIEPYKHGQIVHSLGNFIFDEPYPNSKRSFIYGADINSSGVIVGHQVLPTFCKHCIPEVDPRLDASRTVVVANQFHKLYDRKDKRFWKSINGKWLSDIVWRVTFMKSLKFLRLPPLGFYFSIGFGSLLKKFSLKNIVWAFRLLFKQIARQ